MLIGKYLKGLMKHKKITQQKLAEFTGLSQSYISHLCTDRKSPSLETIDKICESLEITPGQFFNFQEYSGTASTLWTVPETLSAEQRRLLEQLFSTFIVPPETSDTSSLK